MRRAGACSLWGTGNLIQRRPGSRGMTLMEIVIAVALVALAAGIAVPSLGHLTRARLRHSATELAQYVRQAYALAALGGETGRMVLAPGASEVRIEVALDEVRLEAGKAVSLQGDFQRLFARSQAGSSLDANAQAAQEALLGLPFAIDPCGLADLPRGHPPPPPAFAGVDIKPLKLQGGVHILDVWTDGMSQPVTDGEAYLYFFPQGYTQNALIHLEDADKRVFGVRIHALTGRADIDAGYQEHPK